MLGNQWSVKSHILGANHEVTDVWRRCAPPALAMHANFARNSAVKLHVNQSSRFLDYFGPNIWVQYGTVVSP